MYQQLYDLISNGVFDGVLTPFQDEVVQVLSTCGSLVVVALPFAIVLALIQFVVNLAR